MKDVITYVGIDAHNKDLSVAMLIGPRGDADGVDGRPPAAGADAADTEAGA